MAEELAWLIRDSFSCKHLVLSAEEAFVSFLDPHNPSLRKESVLMLEPMVAYHRMLLHRLADIFKLGHQSIGEGSNRHLVLERCEESRIPDVLVRDILDYSEDEPLHSTLQLLKRASLSDSSKYTQLQPPSLSFEERQAAYLAARERIFSEEMAEPLNKSIVSRPRSVPIVARRMIAHALGKPVVAEQSFKMSPCLESTSGQELDAGGQNSQSKEKREEPILAHVSLTTAEPGPENERLKVLENLHVKAAKRMFAHALGFGLSKSSSSRHTGLRNTEATCLPERSGTSDVGEVSTLRSCEKFTESQDSPYSLLCTSRSVRKSRTERSCMQQNEKIVDEPSLPAVSHGQMLAISKHRQRECKPTERYSQHGEMPSETLILVQAKKGMVPPNSISSQSNHDDCLKSDEEDCVNKGIGKHINLLNDQCSHPPMKAAQVEQGKAAQRMLAQALGFQTFSLGADRSRNV